MQDAPSKDNAPSHQKRAADSLHLPDMKQKDGCVGPARRDTVYPASVYPDGHDKEGEVQRLVNADGTNKGCMRLGFERVLGRGRQAHAGPLLAGRRRRQTGGCG
jgi:hypothetical protein